MGSLASDLPLFATIGVLVAAAAATWAAGTRLTGHVDAVASTTGARRTLLGAILLGGITSLPEAATMTTAAALGGGSLAVGNVLGSASANLAILAGCDIAFREVSIIEEADRREVRQQGLLLVLLLALMACAGLIGAPFRFEVGVWTLGISGVALTAFVVLGVGSADPDGGPSARDEPDDARGFHVRRLVGAGAVIVVAGYAAATAGTAIAEKTGLSSGFVGFALLAVSTSLPELSTTVSALRLRRVNLAFGNILGTNIFNHLLLLPADAVDRTGSLFASPSPSVVAAAVLGILLVGVYLVALRMPSRHTGPRTASAVLLALYGAGTFVVYRIG